MATEATPPFFAAERQEKIAALIATRGRIHLDELASVFEGSQPTLRKDLSILQQQGLVKRTHGRAISTRAPAQRDLMSRFVQNAEAKRLSRPARTHLVQACASVLIH